MRKYRSIIILFLTLYIHVAFSQSNGEYYNQVIKHRDKYKRELIRDLHSPITKYDLRFLNFYYPEISYRVNCKIYHLTDQKFFNFLTSSGKKRKYRKYTKLTCEIKDTTVEFFTYESKRLLESEKYKDYIFLPFTDNTNGESTYGGGRYLDLQRNEFSGDSITIDFNLSYNPYCAYSSGYSCAIPPKENALPIFIEAGEKIYSGEKKHRVGSKLNKKRQKEKLKKQKEKLKKQAKKSIKNHKYKSSKVLEPKRSDNKRYFEPGKEKLKIEKK